MVCSFGKYLFVLILSMMNLVVVAVCKSQDCGSSTSSIYVELSIMDNVGPCLVFHLLPCLYAVLSFSNAFDF